MMADQRYPLPNASSEDRTEDEDGMPDFVRVELPVLENLVKYRLRRSTLEILLTLHYCLDNMNQECQCFVINLLSPSINYKYVNKYFSVIKDMLLFLFNKDSKDLVNDLTSDHKSDYQLNLLHLLKISVEAIHQLILGPEEADRTMQEKLRTMLNQSTGYINILMSRHGWHYRKKWHQSDKTSRSGPPLQLTIRSQFFNYYEDCARVGRFPYILWQETPLREKISRYNSLGEIFSKENEKECSICFEDGKNFENNFAIFLVCNHLLCAPCAERLLGDDTKSR